jgi:hypothetical protein
MKYAILIITIITFSGCKQISRSVEETFHPADSVMNKRETETPDEYEYTGTTKISGQITINSTTTTYSYEHKKGKHIPLLTDTSQLARAEKALKNLPQYANKVIYIYSTVYFYADGNIMAMLQNPTNPAYIDSYNYKDGVWSKPQPVQLSIKDDIRSKLIPLNKFHFVNAAKVAGIYKEKAAQIEGAKTTADVYIYIFDNIPTWYPTLINGSRERYSIQFNTDGSLRSFKQQ